MTNCRTYYVHPPFVKSNFYTMEVKSFLTHHDVLSHVYTYQILILSLFFVVEVIFLDFLIVLE